MKFDHFVTRTPHPDEKPDDGRLEREVLEALARHYPKHDWCVMASAAQGVIAIQNLGLAIRFPKYKHLAYAIKMHLLSSEARLEREVMLAGGTLLEFFNASREPRLEEWWLNSETLTPSAPIESFKVH